MVHGRRISQGVFFIEMSASDVRAKVRPSWACIFFSFNFTESIGRRLRPFVRQPRRENGALQGSYDRPTGINSLMKIRVLSGMERPAVRDLSRLLRIRWPCSPHSSYPPIILHRHRKKMNLKDDKRVNSLKERLKKYIKFYIAKSCSTWNIPENNLIFRIITFSPSLLRRDAFEKTNAIKECQR